MVRRFQVLRHSYFVEAGFLNRHCRRRDKIMRQSITSGLLWNGAGDSSLALEVL
jgi:hypothetical protein